MDSASLVGSGTDDNTYQSDTITRCLLCFPDGQDHLKIVGDEYVHIKKNSSLCNIKCLRSWSASNLKLSSIAYLVMESGKAEISIVIVWSLVCSVIIGAAYYAAAQKVIEESTGSAVGILLVLMWVFRMLCWFFLRSSTVVFGSGDMLLDWSNLQFKRGDRDSMTSAYLQKLTGSAAPEQASTVESSTTKAYLCLPNGEDTLELHEKYFYLKKTAGMFGQLCGCEMLQNKVQTYITKKNITWVHTGNSGRSYSILFLGLLFSCVCASYSYYANNMDNNSNNNIAILGGIVFLISVIIWALSAEKVIEFAMKGTPKGYKWGPYAFWGATHSFRAPTKLNLQKIKYTILDALFERPVDRTMLGRWKGKAKGSSEVNELKLYQDHVEVKIAKGWCGCCTPKNEYFILLKDIKGINAGFIGNSALLLKSIFCFFVGSALLAYGHNTAAGSTHQGHGTGTKANAEADAKAKAAAAAAAGYAAMKPYLQYVGGFFLLLCLIFLIAWLCSKKATLSIGASPGGTEQGIGNPFADSPFWVTFVPLGGNTEDAMTNIRLQQQMSARNQKGVPLAGHDLVEVVGEEVEEVEVIQGSADIAQATAVPAESDGAEMESIYGTKGDLNA